ncbi:DUF3093 domain-containing protein [Leucobacter sp. M11]|uniref:DUF3093 domain-containing protein n=1 Tax=Leucobacter sp. M11 TaxID=2993565 RepID=UPI002D80483E|nr:DUF3093 domain-containing protein [Leucobacter sp. M11]MEB4616171.1 DUF3093 domain-containing protein [Leucobacter sp. M11]
MTSYSERLWPTPWLFIACLLFLPAVTLMLTPINFTLAIIVAIVTYAAACWFLILTSPRVTLDERGLTAGRATLPREFIGAVEVLHGDDFQLAIGPKLDARTHLLLRGWIKSGVRIENTDAQDPAPFWIVSSRTPEDFAAALTPAA